MDAKIKYCKNSIRIIWKENNFCACYTTGDSFKATVSSIICKLNTHVHTDVSNRKHSIPYL